MRQQKIASTPNGSALGLTWRTIAVRLASENANIQVQLRAKLRQVQQSRARFVEAAEKERRRFRARSSRWGPTATRHKHLATLALACILAGESEERYEVIAFGHRPVFQPEPHSRPDLSQLALELSGDARVAHKAVVKVHGIKIARA